MQVFEMDSPDHLPVLKTKVCILEKDTRNTIKCRQVVGKRKRRQRSRKNSRRKG